MITALLFAALGGDAAAREPDGDAAVAGAAAAVAVVSVVALVHIVKEQLEQSAVEWVLATKPDLKNFELELVEWEAASISDLSSLTAVVFVVRPEGQKPFLLLVSTDHGWVTGGGVEFSKIRYVVITQSRWEYFIAGYLAAGGATPFTKGGGIPLYERKALRVSGLSDDLEYPVLPAPSERGTISQFVGLQRRMAVFEVDDSCLYYPMLLIDGDTYRVGIEDAEIRVIYNERTLNLFFKADKSLVKLSRTTVGNIARQFSGDERGCPFEEG